MTDETSRKRRLGDLKTQIWKLPEMKTRKKKEEKWTEHQ